MRTYQLSYTNECGADIEQDFEARNNLQATDYACALVTGLEGLVSGVSLITEEGVSLEPKYGWP